MMVGGDREASWVLTRLAGGYVTGIPVHFFCKVKSSVSELCLMYEVSAGVRRGGAL